MISVFDPFIISIISQSWTQNKKNNKVPGEKLEGKFSLFKFSNLYFIMEQTNHPAKLTKQSDKKKEKQGKESKKWILRLHQMFDYFFIEIFHNNVLCGTRGKKILNFFLVRVYVCILVAKNVEKLLRWRKQKNTKLYIFIKFSFFLSLTFPNKVPSITMCLAGQKILNGRWHCLNKSHSF